ncbi:MAG: hypothetical protein ACYCXG_09290 [Acidiferrobacter sp.]
MQKLLALDDRTVFLVSGPSPAVYYITDPKVGGILVNAPLFSEACAAELAAVAPLSYVFLPSHWGARDLPQWRQYGACILAGVGEVGAIDSPIDIVVDSQKKLTRTIDFLPIAGRTPGTCGLRFKNLPGMLFLGPALTPGADGWPSLVAQTDDYSYESRLMGVFGLRDLVFSYLFTDVFVPGETGFGPHADQQLRHHLDALLA